MKLLLAFAAALPLLAQQPDIESIMSRVALNQAKSQDLRSQYVYTQKQLLRMVRPGGKIAREEHRQYTVVPKYRGVKRSLVAFTGRYESHGKYTAFDKPGYHYKGLDLDADLLDSMSDDMTNDGNSQNGIANDLFPLTYHQQLKYNFEWKGSESYRGHKMYRVAFEPKKKGFDDGDAMWKGEALIDAEEYQPVLITTSMAMKLPLAVRTLLGTDIKGLGFTVTYEKFGDGVWFPVSYGGEFQIKGVFFYRRTMSISMVNSDFRRADVNSTVAYSMDGK